MNIFPDANIFVAAFMWEDGVCGRILEVLLAEGKHDLILSEWVWQETEKTLHEDFDVPLERIAAYKAKVLRGTQGGQQPTPLAFVALPCFRFR